MAKRSKFSMRPEMGEEGILSNADVKIAEADCCKAEEAGENYVTGGREADDPIGRITFEYLEGEDDQPVVQFFSAGRAARLTPSEDGEEPADSGPFLIPSEDSKAKGLSRQSRLWQFLNSLSHPQTGKLKFDSRLLDDKGMDAIVGMKLHVLRVPAPAMGGPVEEGGREKTMLICHEILELPKGAKSAKKKAAEDEDEEADARVEKKFPKVAKKAKKEEEEEEEEDEGDEITEEAQAIVVKALTKAGDKGIKKDALAKAVFGAAAKSDNRKQIMNLVQDDDFISEGPWNYDEDDEVLTAAG